MSFSSLQFLLFFPVVTFLYFALPHRMRWPMLLVASAAFYMAFIPIYILILVATILVDYWAGIAISGAEGHRRKAFLVVSLVANIGTLAVFKYYNFFIENVNEVLRHFGQHGDLRGLAIILPIGLSFHTFQAMSYTIEVYRGNQEPERNLGIYALYVMFYPQLVAGPIERPQNLLHQFREEHRFDYGRVTSGLKLMAWGYFKKALIADRVAVAVDTVYTHPRAYTGPYFVIATVLFAFQIYNDFSGYTDIARGAARVMGFELMKNFNRPYQATNLSDFWRRWHISLYTWFNDYLYTPLSLSLRHWGKWAIVVSVMTTFTISGIWHGAAWTYIVWGALHGVGITTELLTRKWRTKRLKKAPRTITVPIAVLLTFTYVNFAYIFFRANSVKDAFYVVGHIGTGWGPFLALLRHGATAQAVFGSLGFVKEDALIVPVCLATVMIVEEWQSRTNLEILFRHRAIRWAAYYAILLGFVFYGAHNAVQPFIYFQF